MSDNFLLNLIENKKKTKREERIETQYSLTDFINILNTSNLKYDTDFNDDVNNLFAAMSNLFFFLRENKTINDAKYDYKKDITCLIESFIEESVKISEANKNKKIINTDSLKTISEKANKIVVNIKKI